jgi:lambda family phage portal protein
MKLLDNLAARLGYFKQAQRAPRRRGFDAAQVSRLTSTWTTSQLSMNQDLLASLPTLRARSRDLANNNDYMRHFLRMCRVNIVGPTGFDLQWQPFREDGTTLDTEDAENLARSFWEWAKVGNCDVTGKLSLVDALNLMVTCWARDGEYLVREVDNPDVNKWGYALQLLDIERLAFNKNEELAGGGYVKMGVEINAVGMPTAYHLHTRHPGETVYQTFSEGKVDRVDARHIIHRFLADRPEQVRGLPWAVSAMKRLWDLGGFDEAAIIAARIGASQMLLMESDGADGEDLADAEGADGELHIELEPGLTKILPPGMKPSQGWNPKFPDAMVGPFIKAMLRGAASGMGVAYNGLANDLEGVNFSSIRQGVLEERDVWMGLQDAMIQGTLCRIATNWLRMALLKGAVTARKGGKPLPFSKFEKFNSYEWTGRRWGWVDPKADMEAAALAMKLRVTSPQRIAAQQGVAFTTVLQEIAEANRLCKEAGLPALSLEEKPAKPGEGEGKPGEEKPGGKGQPVAK